MHRNKPNITYLLTSIVDSKDKKSDINCLGHFY